MVDVTDIEHARRAKQLESADLTDPMPTDEQIRRMSTGLIVRYLIDLSNPLANSNDAVIAREDALTDKLENELSRRIPRDEDKP